MFLLNILWKVLLHGKCSFTNFKNGCHGCSTVTGSVLQQSLARLFNIGWHDCSTATGSILQQSLARFFIFSMLAEFFNSDTSLLKNRAMYQEYDTWSNSYYIHSLFHVFLISIFPYISYFPFLIQGLQKGEIKNILGFAKICYHIKNLFQNWNVRKTCQGSTDNLLSSRFSPYLSEVWNIFTSRVSGTSSE